MGQTTESLTSESAILERTAFQLTNLGLSLKDVQGKVVLDVGAGDAFLESAVKIQNINAKVFSIDLQYPSEATTPEKFAIADAINPPFPDETFDLILAHASGTEIFRNGPHILRNGGQIRQYPLYGYDDHCMLYCLVNYKGYSEEEALERMDELYKMNETNEFSDYGPCAEWSDLEEAARIALSREEKLSLVEPLVKRWSEVVDLKLTYEITGWAYNQPTVVLIYSK